MERERANHISEIEALNERHRKEVSETKKKQWVSLQWAACLTSTKSFLNFSVMTVRQRQSTGAVGTRPTAVQSANRHTGVENTKGTARENEKQGTE